MASTILVRHALWRVSVLLSDTDAQYTRWPEVELVQWLQDAQNAIVKMLPLAGSRIDAIKLVPGALQSIASIPAASCKPGDGSTPSVPIIGRQFLRPICNMGTDGLTPGIVPRVVERDMLDAQDPTWQLAANASKTVREVVIDQQNPRYFMVSPPVHATTAVWMRMSYVANPLAIPAGGAAGAEVYAYAGSSTQTITIDDEYIDDIVDYVAARAHLKDSKYAEPVRHQLHAGRFLASINGRVAALTGTNPNFTVLPGVSMPGAPV